MRGTCGIGETGWPSVLKVGDENSAWLWGLSKMMASTLGFAEHLLKFGTPGEAGCKSAKIKNLVWMRTDLEFLLFLFLILFWLRY